MLQLEAWQVISILLTCMGGFLAGLQFLFLQFRKALDEKFGAFDKRFGALEAEAKQWQQMERELLELKAELPLHYVRREDYVRNQTVIESKLDAIAVRQENFQLREASKQ
ncbi:hypothetical protein [Gilvimarinus agarilyticus]|uniref:hypothetical protein n=1 Tax=Gilvimarinus agarilyticus TaxID=679259 RepID=UPI0005A0E37D|nr:hypothetical protein [Gilvimarinus agarilyticus]